MCEEGSCSVKRLAATALCCIVVYLIIESAFVSEVQRVVHMVVWPQVVILLCYLQAQLALEPDPLAHRIVGVTSAMIIAVTAIAFVLDTAIGSESHLLIPISVSLACLVFVPGAVLVLHDTLLQSVPEKGRYSVNGVVRAPGEVVATVWIIGAKVERLDGEQPALDL